MSLFREGFQSSLLTQATSVRSDLKEETFLDSGEPRLLVLLWASRLAGRFAERMKHEAKLLTPKGTELARQSELQSGSPKAAVRSSCCSFSLVHVHLTGSLSSTAELLLIISAELLSKHPVLVVVLNVYFWATWADYFTQIFAPLPSKRIFHWGSPTHFVWSQAILSCSHPVFTHSTSNSMFGCSVLWV